MSGDADNWMPLFIGDYLADTGHLSVHEHGAYLLLIMAYWRRSGPLPDDDIQLARLVRAKPREWKKLRPVIAAFFNVDNGLWHHKRIENEIEWCQIRADRRKKKTAAATAARRKSGQRDDDVTDNVTITSRHRDDELTTNVTCPSPSPSPQSREPDGSLESGAHSAPTPTKAATNGAHHDEQRARNRGSRLEANWEPEPQDRQFAGSLGLDTDAIAPSFRDYWLARAGPGGVKRDWSATWRNWCRKEAERVGGRSAPQRSAAPSVLAAGRAALARIRSA